jgi:post-segregation antitoxin (ccd killing protein)
VSYEDQTKEELQEELRERDLKVSGTKDELIERIEEDDESGDEFEGQTKEELQEELRERDLKVSGTKDELIERLEEHESSEEDGDEDAGADDEGEDDGADDDGADDDGEDEGSEDGEEPQRERDERAEDRRGDPSERRGLTARDALRSAARQLQELGGRQVDGVAGFERIDGGWRVLLEVVEVSRVPSSTDILGAYEVMVDDDGELVGYERIRRYVRSQAGGDEE